MIGESETLEKETSPAKIDLKAPSQLTGAKKNYTRLKVVIWASVFIVSGIAVAVLWNYQPSFKAYVQALTPTFYYFLLAGFIFAMVDGAIGMSYGVTSTSFALTMGIPPASASTAVHLSEILSCGIAGYMHKRMGNINKKLFWLLIVPGITGAVLGAYLLSSLEHYSSYTKPVVSLYTLILGWVILSRSFKVKAKARKDKKITNIRLLGFGGGFIDAVGGGGVGLYRTFFLDSGLP